MARETKTISIQPDLSGRMAKFSDENWSAIACRAFEIRLVELEAMNRTDEDKGIARLKASKMRAVDRLFRDGEAAGKMYVVQHAEYLELERLAESHERDLLDLETEDCSFRALAHVMSDGDGSESEIDRHMRQRHGDDIDRAQWLQGFVEGVVTKYYEIGSRLD
jgi:hypothetical protein